MGELLPSFERKISGCFPGYSPVDRRHRIFFEVFQPDPAARIIDIFPSANLQQHGDKFFPMNGVMVNMRLKVHSLFQQFEAVSAKIRTDRSPGRNAWKFPERTHQGNIRALEQDPAFIQKNHHPGRQALNRVLLPAQHLFLSTGLQRTAEA